jgi:hypothetical protein
MEHVLAAGVHRAVQGIDVRACVETAVALAQRQWRRRILIRRLRSQLFLRASNAAVTAGSAQARLWMMPAKRHARSWKISCTKTMAALCGGREKRFAVDLTGVAVLMRYHRQRGNRQIPMPQQRIGRWWIIRGDAC